ncbi:ribosome maturation factor RimP [Aquihabitans sp. G128]|uniref:ribosome maturation factor RimP n=1 Tax=Aquihabitans sp. G128 TaxID=2849779 RepID=UPI001C214CB2|nr:ribosome maturation factor RimP [Aquihabitans sp. G128]QXC62592.1 ribosome maturation factor RimP [Aquihabitans sp. G128]
MPATPTPPTPPTPERSAPWRPPSGSVSSSRPLLEDVDAELYDIEFTGGVLKITVDREGGVDMGAIGSFTRAVSRMLDDTDPIPSAFTLEVSSPGLERPLRTPEHFARSVGEVVSVKVRAGLDGDRRFKATIVSVADDQVVLLPEGAAPGAERTLGLHDIERARTIFEWGPAPKPGGPKPGGKAAPKTSPSAKKKAANP